MVYYEDTDAQGVVYYANYLRFMERARTEWLRALGFEQDALMADEGVMFAVVHADITFRRAARFNDLLDATVSIEDYTRTGECCFGRRFIAAAGRRARLRSRDPAACLDTNAFPTQGHPG